MFNTTVANIFEIDSKTPYRNKGVQQWFSFIHYKFLAHVSHLRIISQTTCVIRSNLARFQIMGANTIETEAMLLFCFFNPQAHSIFYHR